MHILVTGYTAFHIGRRKNLKRQGVANNVEPLIDTFRKLGHTVENRTVEPGEDLSVFDKIFVFIIEVSSLNARYAAGCLYILRERPDAFMIVDDLKINLEVYRKQYLTKYTKKKIFRAKGYYYKDKIWRESWEDYLIETCGIIANEWPNRIILPSVLGGDMSNLQIPSKEYYQYDPSPHWEDLFDDIKFDYATKQKKWSLVSLFPERNKDINNQEFNWEVLRIGDRDSGIGRIPEIEAVQYYADNWGLIFNTWKKPGALECGFWTFKYICVKKFGNIPFGKTKELEFVGPTWKWCTENLSKIEQMSNAMLAEIHRTIVEELDTKLWKREQLREFCEIILRE